jgi:hypothetical protein
MSEAIDGGSGSVSSWTVLDREGWDNTDELLMRLVDALAGLGPDEEVRLYDHVAVEPLLDALDPESRSCGVTEIIFEYGRYEIKITRAGVIAVSPDPDAPPRLSD